MKYRKLRLLSVVCVASLLISQGAIAAYSVDDGETDPTSSYSETNKKQLTSEILRQNITVEKVYDKLKTAEITVNQDLFEGYNVQLTATAEFDNSNAGENKKVYLTDISLTGDDSIFFELVGLSDNSLELDNGIINRKEIVITPKNTTEHYSDEIPVTVGVNDVKNQIISGDKINDIPSEIYIMESQNDYYYSFEKTAVVNYKDSTTNNNYKFKIGENIKPDVGNPTPAELLSAEFDSSTIPTYDNELGFITKDDVKIVLNAQPGNPDRDSLSFYIITDNEPVKKEFPAKKDNGIYKSDPISLKEDDGMVRNVEIKCSLKDSIEPSIPVKFSNGTNESSNLIIDKEEPSEKNDNNLELKADNKNQQICLSGTVCDEGSGIASISYNWEKDKEKREGQISDIELGTKELNINSVPLFTYSELPDGNNVTVTVTDRAGNSKKFTLSCADVDIEFAKPVIKSITLKNGEETELDKFLNILSFGIYSKNELTLEIKAAPAEFYVEKESVTVSLLCKNDDGNTVIYNNQIKTAGGGVLQTFNIGDEAVADQLSVMLENGYGNEEIITLREALKTVHSNGEDPQWSASTPDTDNSDKWVFDYLKPELKINLDEAYDNRYYIDPTTEVINITATDNLSGVKDIHVYNQSILNYIISDENGKEILISDENNINYTVSSIDEKSITIVDTDGNEDKIDLQGVDDSSNENDVTEYEINTRDKYFIKNSKGFVITGIRAKIEGFDLIARDESDVKHYYPIKSKDTEIASGEEINFRDNSEEVFKVPVKSLIPGNNTLFVSAKDNAGNEVSGTFDVYYVETIPVGKLSLLVPKTSDIDDKEWVLEKEILEHIEEQSNSDKPKASVKLSLENDTNSINYIDVTVNGISVYNKSNTPLSHALFDDINGSDGTLIIELDNNTLSQLINTDDYKNNNIIRLQATMETSIFNSSSQEISREVHVDKEKPEIGTFKISKTNDSIEDIIHILTFGVFCNNKVKISTDVTEPVNDVGIENVQFYDTNGNPFETLHDENTDTYSIELSGDAQVYQTGVKVVSTDKLGNTSTQLLDTSNVKAENGDDLQANLVLIENNPPKVEISVPESPYNSDTGQCWFDNADKEISFKVTDFDSGIRNIKVSVNGKFVTKASDISYKQDPVNEQIADASILTADDSILSESKSIGLKSKITEADYSFSINDLIEKAGNDDGEYTLIVYVTDNAGNANIEENSKVTFFRDIKAPEVTGIMFSPDSNGKTETSDTDNNYKLIDQDQNIKKTDYGYYFQKEFTLKVKAKDSSASSGLKTATVTLMEYNDDGTYNERDEKTVNFITGTESSDKENVIGESEGIEIPEGFKGMILAKVTDNTGNISGERSPRAFVSDNTKPEISIKVNNEPLPGVVGANEDKLYTDNVSFTVTITDTKSGLKEVEYNGVSDSIPGYNSTVITSIDDLGYKENETDIGGWVVKSSDLNVVTSVEKTFTYGESGDDTGIYATFRAKDNADNTNENETFKFTIDRINPEIDKVLLNSPDGTKEVEFTDDNEVEYIYFYKEPFSVTTESSDPSPSSGLNKMDYRFVSYNASGDVVNDDTSVKDVKIEAGKTEDVQIPSSFTKGQIFVKAYDNTLRNISVEKGIFGVVIDHTSPTITIESLPDTNGENNAVDNHGNVLYNDPEKVRFRVTVADSESGIKNIHYTKTSEKTVGVTDVQTEIDVSNNGYAIDSIIGSADNASNWTIEAMDHNLVTKVSRVFTFDEDDADIQFSFDATDRSDNTSNEETSQSFTIDTVAPTVTGVSFSAKTADNILGVKPEEFIEELEYGYYFKEQTVITASCEDGRPSSGLNMISFRFVPYKDREQIEQSKYAEPKKSDVKEVVVAKKVVNGKATCTVEKGFKGQIFITAYDYAAFYYDVNTSEEITTQAFVIEDNAPEIKIAELPETDLTDNLGNKLYTKRVNFKVTITDTESGLREVTYAHRSDNIKENENSKKTISQVIANVSGNYDVGYTFKDTGWTIDKMDNNLITQVSQTFVFDKDDKNIYMIFGATDRSNNKTDDKDSEKFTIDTVSPTVEKFNFEPASEDNISEVTDFIEEFEYGYYFKKSFNAVVTVNDKIPSSGLDKVVFRLVAYENGEMISEQSYSVLIKNKKATYLIPEGFKGQVYAQVFDRAVNKSLEETPQAFVVDEVSPTITIEPLPDNKDKTDMDGNKLYAEAVEFKVTITDDKSGLRSVSYSKNSEKDSYNDIVTQVQNVTGYNIGDSIGDGWHITKMDRNLITQIEQVFSFTADDNHIIMNYRATDRSMNTSDIAKSEGFTIDTTAPVVRVSYPEPVNGRYYKGSVTFNFSITERNFDSSLMERTIKDSFRSNNDLQISYNSSSTTEHTATVTFPEGDYQFTYRGEDRGGNGAQIFDNGNAGSTAVFSDSFNVDSTAPQITTNFNDFVVDNKDEYYFNTDKTVEISVVEHNFYAYDMGLSLEKKSSGSGHTSDGEGWYEIGSYSGDWKQDASNSDRYTLSIHLEDDAIYRITINPTDRTGNDAATVRSSIFEIDKTPPHLASRNGVSSSMDGFVVSPFQDVYDEKRKEDPAPSLRFDDSNFDRLVIEAIVYKPRYINENQIISIDKDAVSDEISKTSYDKDFSLDKYFTDDGVYILKFVAYDKAGNSCEEVNDTYFKMVSTDILAYLDNSNSNNHTGYYSLMDENQRAISKKASDFSDLDIRIITKSENKDAYDVQIRDEKNQYSTKEYATLTDENISKTSVIKTIHLPGSYFSETFKDDSLDARMYLSVYYKDTPYDLATIHIDNEKPSANLPDYFHSWSNVMFTDNVEVTLTNISEKLDMSRTKIYECPREGERVEVQLTDADYDESKKTLTFTLSEGIHNIDISLVDEAGNEWNVDRIRYFTVGNLWLYVGIGVILVIAAIVIIIFLIRKNKKSKKNTFQTS